MRILLICIVLAFSGPISAQNDVLLTINDQEVTVDEFTSVYEKNLSLVDTDGNATPKGYLDLFIDYKLKVLEAYRLGLDQKESYKKELASYRNQLAKNHLTDVKVTESLVKEAYDRMLTERRARHILVRISSGAPVEDTVAAFKKIMNARSRIAQGESFEKVARELSEDPSASKNAGDLGWFKAFKMVYPFESAAYSTAINEVSRPFRTRFGYHIVQPTDSRRSKGSRKVAHIMVSLKQQDTALVPEERINKVARLLQEGSSFEALAKNYSDDANSAQKGGMLSNFEEGQLRSKVFEKVAFGLEKEGAISAPFKTDFGWHIIKLIEKKPIGIYKDLRTSLTQRVKKDARAQVISDNLSKQLRDQYNIGNLSEVSTFFKEQKNTLEVPIKTAFTINDVTYTYQQVGNHIDKARRGKQVDDLFIERTIQNYVDGQIRSYHLSNLESVDADFNALLREYKEGLLLFDLLETKIWNVAKTDSSGLDRFYQAHIKDYKTPKSLKSIILSTKDKKVAKEFVARLKKGNRDADAVIMQLEKEYNTPIIATSKTIAIEDVPKGVKAAIGTSKVIENNGQFMVYVVKEIIDEKQKTLNEARGIIMSDYQKYLENSFVAVLKDRSTILIKSEVLDELSKRYND